MTILEMSVSGAAMILIITLIRALFIHKLPKKAFVLMWEITILRLLLPIRIPSIISVFTLVEHFLPQEIIYINPITEPSIVVSDDSYLEIAQARNTLNVPVCEIVWLVGVVIIAAVFIGLYILYFKKYRFAERVNVTLPEELKLRRKVEIRVCGGISSPLTYGLIKPVILLPKTFEMDNSEQLKFVLAHEITHIKRFDVLRKIAVIIAVCVHWFNPLVWVLFVLFNRDIELVCDDIVIGKIGHKNRREYAMALVEMLDSSSVILHNYFSKNAVEERIVSISKHKETNVLSGVIAGILSLCVTAVFATSSAMYGWKKLNQIDGFERIFDSPITRITLVTGGNNERVTYAEGQPFIVRWSEFLNNLELHKTSGVGILSAERIIIENEEKTFEILIKGKDDDDFNESTLVINGVFYEYRSSAEMPIDKLLYPFGSKLDEYIVFSDIYYDKDG